jgi:DNA-binding CsgD family transcriptional regulator
MASPETIADLLAELRAGVPTRRRPASRVDSTPLIARLIAACHVVAIEERSAGIAFRLECAGADNLRVTCLVHQPSPAPLTAAEAAVAEQVCEGRTLAQIAHLRGVSINTIKSQVRQLFRKLEVDSRVALVRKLAP